ncbi:IS5/IS1182 family transposase, partial [Streptomyces sp. NPDC056534]
EHTNSWMNNIGKLRRCTERRKTTIEFYIAPACVFVTVRHLIRQAWTRYQWNTRPRTSRIR